MLEIVVEKRLQNFGHIIHLSELCYMCEQQASSASAWDNYVGFQPKVYNKCCLPSYVTDSDISRLEKSMRPDDATHG